MSARELTLNIAVNLGRLGRWACEGRISRIHQFLAETDEYINLLEQAPKDLRFLRTFRIFKKAYNEFNTRARFDLVWAEMMFTWANILTHRAPLA